VLQGPQHVPALLYHSKKHGEKNIPAITEVDRSLFPRMGLTLPSRLGGTKKLPSQLAAPTLELKT